MCPRGYGVSNIAFRRLGPGKLDCKLARTPGCQIRVEPALFEWLAWYTGRRPNFLTPAELCSHGYPVDTNYRPVGTFSASVATSLSSSYAVVPRVRDAGLPSSAVETSTILVSPHETICQYYERTEQLAHALLAVHTEPGAQFVHKSCFHRLHFIFSLSHSVVHHFLFNH
ncbi:unnamed protein product [Protopolystoma xenopodis]|uniref:Uncharacterized protein n=1 Tax=Protopolystoma xenopodis TaxID=117903 RepID=A0A3S5C5C4_9PLAT|nr:unnamed protein product [Protopolystoma xenopodis]